MIRLITKEDRKRSGPLTKGKKYKLISKTSGRVYGYAKTKQELKERERQIGFFKNKGTK